MQSSEKFDSPPCPFPAEVKQRGAAFYNSQTVNKCPFRGLIRAVFFTFFVLFFVGVVLLFKMVPEHSAEVLSSVPGHKKAEICLTEKICVNEVSSDIHYSAVGMSLMVMSQQ